MNIRSRDRSLAADGVLLLDLLLDQHLLLLDWHGVLLHVHLLLLHGLLLHHHLLLLHLLRLHLLLLARLSVRVVSVHDLLLLGLLRHTLEWIDVIGVLQVVLDDVVIERGQATLLEIVLACVQVESLRLHLLEELLLLAGPVITLVHRLVATETPSL